MTRLAKIARETRNEFYFEFYRNMEDPVEEIRRIIMDNSRNQEIGKI